MTTENISLNITGNALQSLQKLETQMGKVSSKFAAFRNVLSGIAVSGFVANTLKFADSIQDLSNATGLATESVLGFSRAVQLNGGTIENAEAALGKFNLSIAEAANGGLASQDAFAKVGLSLQDLATLSEQALFDKVVQGLSQIKDRATAAAVSNELFGKSLRGVELSKLANDYSSATKESAKYSESIAKGAAAQQEIETALNNLKLTLLGILSPIGELAKTINNNIDSISRWGKVLFEVIKVIGGLFIFGKVITLFSRGINAVKGFVVEWKLLKLSLKEIQNQTVLTNKGIYKAIQGIETFIRKNPELAKLKDQFIKVKEGAQTAAMAVLGFLGSITGLTVAYKKYNEVVEEQNLDEIINYIDDLNQKSTEAWEAANAEAEAKRQVIDANLKLNNSIKEVSKAYEKNREEMENAMEMEVAFAMMSSDTAEQIRAQQSAYNEIVNAVDELRKKKQDLGKENDQQRVLIDREIAALLATIPAATEAARVRVEALQNIRDAQNELLKQTELMKMQLTDDANLKALQDQIALIQLYGDELENANIALQVSQSLEQTLLELRKQELDLIARKGQLTDEQFQRELSQIEQLRQAAYKRAGAEIDAKTQVQQAQRVADEDSILGIKKYVDELEKSISPAKRALDSVQSVFNNMESALETFVRTGKFSFKDFASSVIRDLAMIQAKAALVAVFKTVLGSIFPGFAEGGSPPVNKPSIVGEKGPELFVPKTAGTIIPNDQLGKGKGIGSGAVSAPITNNYITNNINALDAKSVAQVFAENRKAIFGANKMAEREMSYAGAR